MSQVIARADVLSGCLRCGFSIKSVLPIRAYSRLFRCHISYHSIWNCCIMYVCIPTRFSACRQAVIYYASPTADSRVVPFKITAANWKCHELFFMFYYLVSFLDTHNMIWRSTWWIGCKFQKKRQKVCQRSVSLALCCQNYRDTNNSYNRSNPPSAPCHEECSY